jgi:molybdopterin converting factor subunit 1
MRVSVKLFAQLRDVAGTGDLRLDVPVSNDAATVAEVWRVLETRFPDLARFDGRVSCAVNAHYARLTAAVKTDDEVAFLPPVSGG